MSLYRRGGIWWMSVYFDGLRYQRSTRTRNRRIAERVRGTLRDQIVLERFRIVEADPRLTFGELADRFLSFGDPKPFHHDRLKQLLPAFAQVRVLNLRASTLLSYREGRKSTDLVKDATINRDLSVVRRILNWAIDERLIPTNPLGRLRLPTERPDSRPVMAVEEEDRILASASIGLRPIIIAALDTGMRRGELLNQRWEHLDLTRKVLFVSHSKTVGGEGREIPLTERFERILSASGHREGTIFSREGGPVRSFKTAWKTAVRRAQLRHFRFHDLRHTFNTRLMEAGVLPDVRMALMGHSSGLKVHARYSHVSVPAKRDAIARLERWVIEQREKRPAGESRSISQTAKEVLLRPPKVDAGSKRTAASG